MTHKQWWKHLGHKYRWNYQEDISRMWWMAALKHSSQIKAIQRSIAYHKKHGANLMALEVIEQILERKS